MHSPAAETRRVEASATQNAVRHEPFAFSPESTARHEPPVLVSHSVGGGRRTIMTFTYPPTHPSPEVDVAAAGVAAPTVDLVLVPMSLEGEAEEKEMVAEGPITATLPPSAEEEEVHSCMTLSSTRTSSDNSQMASPTTALGGGDVHHDVSSTMVEDEEAPRRSMQSHSSNTSSSTPGATATKFHTPVATQGSYAESDMGHSPLPTAPVQSTNEQPAAPLPYSVLDSESSGRDRPPKRLLQTTLTAAMAASSAAAPSTTTTTTEAAARNPVSDGAPPVSPSLSEEQSYALHLAVKEHRSIFITGGAGTGKSFLLRSIIQRLPISTTFITATTGIAALNISGTTLHSFVGCGIPKKTAKEQEIVAAVFGKQRCVRNWRMCRVLVIDEVSMLEAPFFDLVDNIARRVRNRPLEPFGGIQLILSGDFLQLPPVAKERGPNTGTFCFETTAWLEVNPKLCVLSTPFRQRDLRFFSLLNEMRFGDLQPDSISLLNGLNRTRKVNFVRRIIEGGGGGVGGNAGADSPNGTTSSSMGMFRTAKREMEDGTLHAPSLHRVRLGAVDGRGQTADALFDGYTILRSTRVEVESQNRHYYHQLDTEEFVYQATDDGPSSSPANTVATEVRLRKGCRVMLIKNVDVGGGLVNGSTGTVTEFLSFAERYAFRTTGMTATDARGVCVGRGRNLEQRHTMLPVVAFDVRDASGKRSSLEVVVEPQDWVEKEGKTVKSRTVQIPLILAYAITIHKSQGMSLTQVDIDFHKIFEAGQSYVALSRCTDLNAVRLHNFSAHIVSTNSKALAYYKAVALWQRRLAWQREHTPQVVAEQERLEARSCTPYGYVLSDELRAMMQCGMEDAVNEWSFKAEMRGGEEKLEEREGEGQGQTPLQVIVDAVRIDTLRRHVTPLLLMADTVKRLVLREMRPLLQIRNTRLVMDITALSHLVTGPDSATAFDLLFGQLGNMMRVPLSVQQLVEEAAAYRSCSQSVTPQLTQCEGDEAAGGGGPSDAPLLTASDVAAEALVVMERARQDFILDSQRPEQRAELPLPDASWRRFTEVLPLLRQPPPVEREEGEEGSASEGRSTAAVMEVNFILNRDPREAVQHRDIIEYALYLREHFGQDVAVCTDSIVLGAYVLAWGLRLTSADYLTEASS